MVTVSGLKRVQVRYRQQLVLPHSGQRGGVIAGATSGGPTSGYDGSPSHTRREYPISDVIISRSATLEPDKHSLVSSRRTTSLVLRFSFYRALNIAIKRELAELCRT